MIKREQLEEMSLPLIQKFRELLQQVRVWYAECVCVC
jgi:hypothetical protein